MRKNFNPALVGAKSDQGPVRKVNEDAYWVSNINTPTEFGALFLVADGVGGQQHGDVAAQKAVQIVSKIFYQSRQEGKEIDESLKQAILKANQAIYEDAQKLGGVKMGCTLVAAVEFEGQLFVAHVGDARAYRLMGNKLRRLTRDDTWVQRQVEAGIITLEQAENHELKNVVTQVLGNKEEIDVHLTTPQGFNPGDIILLSSDGLHGPLSNEQLFRLMKNNAPQVAANALVQAAVDAGTSDNATAVVVQSSRTEDSGKGLDNKQPKEKQGGFGLPLWVAATLIAIILLAIILTVVTFWPSGEVSIDLGDGENGITPTTTLPTEMPAAIPFTPTKPPPSPVPAEIAPSVTNIPQATNVPQPTMTTALADTPILTVPIPPTEDVTDLACVIGTGFLYVWQDQQIRTTTCDQFAEHALEPGDLVMILDGTIVSVTGPDEFCVTADFIKIRSVDDPQIEGWVMYDRALPLPLGGSCPPG